MLHCAPHQRRSAVNEVGARLSAERASVGIFFAFALALAGCQAAFAAEPQQSEGASLLSAIQSAAQHQNYAGTFIYQQGSQVQSTRVVHVNENNSEFEKLELLDGRIREFIRHDDEVRCYVPDKKLILIESHAKPDQFPALLSRPASDIDAEYSISRSGVERVAGRPCNVVQVEPRDALRYGYKLWSDQATGLLLRAQTMGPHGEVLEQVEFTDITIGGRIDRNRLKPSAASVDGWTTEQFQSVPADFAAQGWHVNVDLPGFTRTLESKRTFGTGREVGQMVYSDGLASVSVFIEPVGAKGAAEGDASKGPINVARRRYGDFWVTVVGEVPASTIHLVADSVQLGAAK